MNFTRANIQLTGITPVRTTDKTVPQLVFLKENGELWFWDGKEWTQVKGSTEVKYQVQALLIAPFAIATLTKEDGSPIELPPTPAGLVGLYGLRLELVSNLGSDESYLSTQITANLDTINVKFFDYATDGNTMINSAAWSGVGTELDITVQNGDPINFTNMNGVLTLFKIA